MALQKIHGEIVAIVPAYNEGRRLGEVLRVLTAYSPFSEIIVVDDGSTDDTARVARSFGVQVLQNEQNLGKGASMDKAVQASSAPVLFFSDADIRGLTHEVIDAILEPVVRGKVEMFIGMRNRKIYYVHQLLSFIPLLGGERACTRRLWEKLPAQHKSGFKIETALNFYAKQEGKGFDFQVFSGLTQTIKERKYGLRKGFVSRIRMFQEIISTHWELQKVTLPLPFLLRKKEQPESD